MTTRQMLEALAASLQARLVGWSVYPHPVHSAAHRQATLAVTGARATPFRYAGPGVEGVVQVVLTVSTAGGANAYHELMDALDVAVLAVYDVQPLLVANGAELAEPEMEAAVAIQDDATQAIYWRADLRTPYRRAL